MDKQRLEVLEQQINDAVDRALAEVRARVLGRR